MTSVSESQILDALRTVKDPQLNKSIVELNLVEKIEIDESEVRVLVSVPLARNSLAAELNRRISEALARIVPPEQVHLDIAVMTDEQIRQLRELLKPRPVASAENSDEKPERAIPFADATSKTRVLAISSGKGGVGKSSVTVNLAVALAKRGNDVAIIDSDVYGFSVPKMLGINEEPVVIEDLIIPAPAHGVRCISIGFFVGEDQAVMWRGPMLHKALEQFLVDVYWGEPDYLLVDMPPGTGDVAISMAQYLPKSEVFVVTTPQLAAQRVAQRTALMAEKLNLSLAGVIENMSWFIGDDGKRYELFGSGGGMRLAEQLNVPLFGEIPLVPSLREGGDEGVPVTVSNPDSEASKAFAALAERIEESRPRRVYRSELSVR